MTGALATSWAFVVRDYRLAVSYRFGFARAARAGQDQELPVHVARRDRHRREADGGRAVPGMRVSQS